jgi:hypothetical protein
MTLEDMMTVFRAAARRERDEFQAKHPHYTPPPWAGLKAWGCWVIANKKLHGEDGFRERFPRHAAILDDQDNLSSGAIMKLLRSAS